VITALIGVTGAFWLYLKRPGKADSLAKSLRGIYTNALEQVLRGRTLRKR